MTLPKFEQLDPIKIPLIKRFYKIHYPSTKVKSSDTILTASIEHSIVAVVRFKPVAEHFLLTGMTVDRSLRNQGIGGQLLTYCQQSYLDDKYYCFALQHLEPFYQRFGFTTVAKETLPNDLRVLFERYTNSGKTLKAMNYSSN